MPRDPAVVHLDALAAAMLVTREDAIALIDMGYDEPELGLDYDGLHHSEDRGQYVYDVGRAEFVEREGWLDIHVVKEHSRSFILYRVR